jgi:trans-2-enoyl-CoA reductase
MQDHEATGVENALVIHKTGTPSQVLEFHSRPADSQPLAQDQVRVRILAAPINPADLNTIEGTYGITLELPATPGIEGCGVVEISQSPDFSPGDTVMFLRRAATWATHATVPSSSLYRLPPGIAPHQAAMLKVNPATAWRLLHGFTHLQPGEWIVQNVGNSAVGRCVIQLAHSLGIHTLSFVRRPEVSAELRALGADHVFTDDEVGLTAARQALGGANASLAFNAVGGDSALRLMKLLRESATHITYGAMGRKPVTIPNGLLIFRDIQVRGLWVSRWIENAPPADVQDTYDHLSALVAAGKLIQPIDSTYPLDSYATALARLDAPDRSGKILFTP